MSFNLDPYWTGANPSHDDGVRIPAISPQDNLTPTNNIQPQRQLSPKPGMNDPTQVLPMPPTEPPENPEPFKHTDPANVWLPHKAILKIMSNALPADAKISAEATGMMEMCVLGFIQILTHEAAENVLKKKGRKSINSGDILAAMESNGFESHAEALRGYIKGYWVQQKTVEQSLRKNMRHGLTIPEPEDEDMGKGAIQDQEALQYRPSSGPAIEPPEWPYFPSYR